MTPGAFDRPLIFQHIPKTAGSTLNGVFTRIFSPDIRVNNLSRSEITALGMTRNDQAVRAIRENSARDARVRYVGGHVGFGIHDAFPGLPARYVTMLRHPIERSISNLYYVAKMNLIPGLDDATTLDSYIKAAQPNYFLWFSNTQLRSLSADDDVHPQTLPITATTGEVRDLTRADLDAVFTNIETHYELIGTTEYLDEFLVLFASRYGFALNEMVYRDENVNADRPALNQLPTDALAAVEAANQYDIALYDRAVARFRDSIEAAGPAFADDLKWFRELNRTYQRG